jgi:HSP20 family protein
MNINKLAPWNWFSKEQEHEGKALPVQRTEMPSLENSPLLQLHREIDRVFDDVFRGFPLSAGGLGRSLSSLAPSDWLKPIMDIAANDKEYTVTVELPGVAESDVHLELEGDILKIKGDKKQEKEEKEKDFYRVERSYGSFQRTLSLPEDADNSGIGAKFSKGVLTVNIPRKATSKSETKRIPINS